MNYLSEMFRIQAENNALQSRLYAALEAELERLTELCAGLTPEQRRLLDSVLENVIDACCTCGHERGYNDALDAIARAHIAEDALAAGESPPGF